MKENGSIDPAYRTGCKLAVVDATGKVLEIDVIFPHQLKDGEKNVDARYEKSKKTLLSLIDKYDIEVIAIGNGTASRETESFVAEALKETEKEVFYTIVNEAGASVYSASDLAREEFPDLAVEDTRFPADSSTRFRNGCNSTRNQSASASTNLTSRSQN